MIIVVILKKKKKVFFEFDEKEFIVFVLTIACEVFWFGVNCLYIVFLFLMFWDFIN